MFAELREVWNELTAPGGAFEVTHVELDGIRLCSCANAPPTLRELWLGSAAHGDKDYLVYNEERLSYAETHQQAAALAGWLASQPSHPCSWRTSPNTTRAPSSTMRCAVTAPVPRAAPVTIAILPSRFPTALRAAGGRGSGRPAGRRWAHRRGR